MQTEIDRLTSIWKSNRPAGLDMAYVMGKRDAQLVGEAFNPYRATGKHPNAELAAEWLKGHRATRG